MSIGHHQTASGRPLRVSPAWVGAAPPATGSAAHQHLLPVREAVWIWSVRRYARQALWALPAAALLFGWTTLGIATPPGPLVVELAAAWLSLIAMIALAGLLAGSRTRRSAVTGLLSGMAGFLIALPAAALPPGVAAAGSPLTAATMHLVVIVGAGFSGAGWLLLGWAVFRAKLVNPADGILLMLAATAIGAAPLTVEPLPTVGALLLLAAGTGLAWTGNRLLPRA
jgi:Amt family ammonium transporter